MIRKPTNESAASIHVGSGERRATRSPGRPPALSRGAMPLRRRLLGLRRRRLGLHKRHLGRLGRLKMHGRRLRLRMDLV